MLLTILMAPNAMSNERAVTVMSRELVANQESHPVCARKVNKGMAAGVESKNAIVVAPLMIPTTKATTIAVL